ncbi:WGxxGxxG family protein [Falsirhodobacter deserti]|uniref:WGxxGxxG family protein n=1 Tax=Falsirhodobacter deserti TaxID=1365611 RepID=UPI000FE41D5F|nr:WGxxGxxG family protein [Falsirhodobacter deserti]
MSKILCTSAVAFALVASSPVFAQQAAPAPAAVEQEEGFDWGLLGLLGLLGLAGLSGRRRDHTNTTTHR